MTRRRGRPTLPGRGIWCNTDVLARRVRTVVGGLDKHNDEAVTEVMCRLVGLATRSLRRPVELRERAWPAWRTALVIVRPETVLAWHRQGCRWFWTWESRRRFGRPPVAAEVRALIRSMSTANPLWARRGFTAS